MKIRIELTNQHPGGLQTATILATEACTAEPRVILETFDAVTARMRAHLAANLPREATP